MKKLIQNIVFINIFIHKYIYMDRCLYIYKIFFPKLQEDMTSFKNYFIVMLDELWQEDVISLWLKSIL